MAYLFYTAGCVCIFAAGYREGSVWTMTAATLFAIGTLLLAVQ